MAEQIMDISKKSPTGPTERTPKPEYLIARSQLTERGPLGFGPIQFLMEYWSFRGVDSRDVENSVLR